MKRKILSLLLPLMLMATACENGEPKDRFPNRILLEPEPYSTWDKVKMAFGNHDKSHRYCQFVVQKFNNRPCRDMFSVEMEQCKKEKEVIVEKCSYIIENDDECWVAYFVRGYTEYLLAEEQEAYADLMKAEQLNKENECFYDSDTTYFNRHHICSRLGWSIIADVRRGDGSCNGAFATKEDALRKAVEYFEESLEYHIPLERQRRNTYYGLSLACHQLGDDKADYWDAKLPQYYHCLVDSAECE